MISAIMTTDNNGRVRSRGPFAASGKWEGQAAYSRRLGIESVAI